MPEHRIEMWQPAKSLLNSDLYFDVYSDGQKLGTMSLSKGSIDWFPKGKQKSKRITWERFAAAMNYLYDGNALP